MILNVIEKLAGMVDKVISGNFTLTKEELEQRIAKLQERRRRINDELEKAQHKMYVKGWVPEERQKENL